MNILVFDIETIPDTESANRLYDFKDLSREDIAKALFAMQLEKSGSEFIRHHLQKIVAISAVFYNLQQFKVWTLGDIDSDEPEIISRFYDGIDKYTPQLVSWNGSGFDLPVLHYRSLFHGIPASRYWESGEHDQQFKWNNYLNRYHDRHLDLMDVLSSYNGRSVAPLDDIATMIGLPGKMGMSGSLVWDYYCQGKIKEIRDYCETDVLNTFLVYLRFQLIRGQLTSSQYLTECERVKTHLANSTESHLQQFLQSWNNQHGTQEKNLT